MLPNNSLCLGNHGWGVSHVAGCILKKKSLEMPRDAIILVLSSGRKAIAVFGVWWGFGGVAGTFGVRDFGVPTGWML